MLNSRRHVIFAFLVILAPTFAFGAEEASRRSLGQLIDAQIALENARLQILERAKQKMLEDTSSKLEKALESAKLLQKDRLSSSVFNPIQKKFESSLSEVQTGKISERTARQLGAQGFALKYTLDKSNEDAEALHAKLAALAEAKRTLAGTSADIAAAALNSSGPCDYPGCLAILGQMNSGLAAAIADINTRVVINSLENFELRPPSGEPSLRLEAAESAISGTVDLQLRTFVCQRALGRWYGAVEADTEKMGACFAAVAYESAHQAGRRVGTDLRKEHFERPVNENLKISSDVVDRIEKFVMASPDYQLKPWDLYRTCAKEAAGHVIDAAEICYGVLRKNRGRPDFTRKLLDIRGDRAAGGDNSGDWYHFFGMVRVGMAYGRITKILYKTFYDDNGKSHEGSKIGATMISGRKNQGPIDELEEKNDLLGADVGRATLQAVKRFARQSTAMTPSSQACSLDIFHFGPKAN